MKNIERASETDAFFLRTFPKIPTILLLALIAALPCFAQEPPSPSFPEMHWRMIGPFRGGRVVPVTGVPGKPNEYLFGAVDGGVWKTVNGGRTWQPIFDAEPIASIGAIAIAPSDPQIIYVGTGESDMRSDISYGDGIYKSTDGGATLAQYRLARFAKYRTHPRGPARPQYRHRGCARPRLRTECGAWRLSLHRWRRHLDESSCEK